MKRDEKLSGKRGLTKKGRLIMLGFDIKFKDLILYLPLEAGTVMTRRSIGQEEDMYINVGFYDPLTDNIVNWVNENIYLGDSIEITVKQIEKVSEPLRVFNYHEQFNTTKEEADKKTLERFLIFKKELESEGII